MKAFFNGFKEGFCNGFITCLQLLAILAGFVLAGFGFYLICMNLSPIWLIPYLLILAGIAIGTTTGYERYQKVKQYREIIASYNKDIAELQKYLNDNPNLYDLEKESYINRIAMFEDKKVWYEERIKEM